MNPSKMIRSLCIAVAVLAAAFSIQTLKAQQIYSQNFNTDDSANWVVNFSYTGSTTAFNAVSNNLYNFNFDYTTAGIPIAPHSAQFGSAAIHHGLKLSAVYTNVPVAKGSAQTAGMSVAPTNFSVTANFIMHADMWVNVNCTAYAALNTNNVLGGSYATSPHNSTASTVLYGCGYGTAGTTATTPGVTDAIFVGATTDNGSAAMMRIYGPATTGGPGGNVNAQSSLQDSTYQSTGTVTPGFPGDPFVYNADNSTLSALVAHGTRNWTGGTTSGSTAAPPLTTSTNIATGLSWAKYFPPAVVPLAQQIAYPQQTNNCSIPGLPTFGWHDVSVEKVGNVIVYKIDGNIIATGNYSVCGTPAGTYLTFMASRTGLTAASPSTGVNYTNLNFVVFANIVVSNYANVVNISAPTPTCTEGSPGSPGVFTISRSSAGVPLTVSYTLSGTATNGVQYQTLPMSVTFSSGATETNIYVVPIADGIPSATTTVILTLQSGSDYAGAGNAVVNILDNDPVTIDITGSSQAYGRYTTSDFIGYTLTRRGKLTTGSDINVNLSYGGSAVSGADYTPVGSVTIPDGVQTVNLSVTPLNNVGVTTNRTVLVNVAAGSGYNIGTSSASGNVVPAGYPTAPVLLFDDLTSSDGGTNWNITYGCGDSTNDATDYQVNFGMSLGSAAGGISIPPPPGGNANALHVTCNKDVSPGSAGAVNAYYTNVWLSGDFAVRFNMNIIESQTTAISSEGAIFGINHGGSYSNWFFASGGPVAPGTFSSDGIWYFVTAQPGGVGGGDYQEFTGLGGTNGNTGWQRVTSKTQASYPQVFKENPGPFTSLDAAGAQTPGVPANGSPAIGFDASTWSDVEIKQQNNVVTMSINHTVIFTYTNTTVWTGGYLMLGYSDPYGNNIGSPEAGAYYANLQVVQLPPVGPTVVNVTGITASGGNVIIKFTTSNAADTIGSFTVSSSATVAGAYTTTAASIVSLGSQTFQATIPQSGAQQFYRIFHP